MPVFSHQQPGGSGQVPEYTDTVFAGETVIIPVSVSDSGYCAGTSPPVPQIVYFTAISDHFGPPLNPNGCLVPPCATFNPSPTPGTPVSGTFGVSTVFSWQTGCSHLAESIKQNQHKKTYKFLFKATDSFCPVPLVAFLPVTIVVRDLPAVDPPGMLTLGVDSYGDVHLSWKSTSDTINSFKGYYIYSASNPSAPFSLIDSLMNISDSTYIHAGALAQHNVVCYYISVKSRCFGATERFSDTICGTSVNIPGTAERMQPFSVGLNIPNPAIGTTTIPVIVPEDGIIRLNISDLAGNILLSSFCHVKAGENRVEADVSGLAAGVYFYSVGFNGLRYTRKMIINI